MKKMKIVLWGSAIVLGLSLLLQTSAFALFKKEGTLNTQTEEVLKGNSPWEKRSPYTKKNIELSTGIRLSYVEVGNPEGAPVLFLHGYTDTSRSFKLVIEELSHLTPHLRFIAPDLRGHGASSMPLPDTPNTFEIDAFKADIMDFIQRKELKNIHLVGHSMGSVIAQEIVLDTPDQIKSLTLIGAFLNGRKNKGIQEFLMPELIAVWKEKLKSRYGVAWKNKSYVLTPTDLGSDVTDFLRKYWVTGANAKPSFLQSIYQETIEVPLAVWIEALDALGKLDNSKRMEDLETPTLIIWGQGDELILEEDQEKLLRTCKKAQTRHGFSLYYRSYGNEQDKELPGHNLHWGNAERVAKDLLEFISTDSILNR